MTGTVLRAHRQLILALVIATAHSHLSAYQRNYSLKTLRLVPEDVVVHDWREYSSTAGGFSILFPGNPQESSGTVNVGKMIVATHRYIVRDDNTYSVMYFDVPPASGDPKVNADLLVGFRNFAVAELKGTLLSESPITLDHNEGRRLEIEVPKRGTARVIIVVADSRLYRISVVPDKPTTADPDAAKTLASRYLQSFRLLPIDRSAEGEVDAYLRKNPEIAQRDLTADAAKSIREGKALELPLPDLGRDVRAVGTVIVKVIIDEEGKVIAAQALNAHPLVQQYVVNAARKARYSPTLEQGKPVKVLALIHYNFVKAKS